MSLREKTFRAKSALLVRPSWRTLEELRAADRMDPDALGALRRQRSIESARFAYNNSPFYRDHYRDHGISAADLADPDAFEALPVVTKQHLRDNFDRIKTAEATRRTSRMNISSGSTGHPLRLLGDRRAAVRAYEWRLQGWWGVEPWEDDATIDRVKREGIKGVLHRMLWWPKRRLVLDTLDLSDEHVDAFVRAWQKRSPACLTGFIPGVVAVARIANARGIDLAAPKAVGVTAGPLADAQRLEMERAFGAPVYDHYRSSEGNYMAGQCVVREGLHTFDDIKNVELLDSEGKPVTGGTVGSTVFTDFTNRVFPLVRYVQGDRSAWIDEPCTCGLPHRRIESIEGRVTDYLTLPSGRVLVGDLLGMFEGYNDYVRQFQLYQGADHAIDVRVVLTDDPRARDRAEERVSQLRHRAGDEVRVEMRVVSEIVPIKGKFRYVISEVAPDQPARSEDNS